MAHKHCIYASIIEYRSARCLPGLENTSVRYDGLRGPSAALWRNARIMARTRCLWAMIRKAVYVP